MTYSQQHRIFPSVANLIQLYPTVIQTRPFRAMLGSSLVAGFNPQKINKDLLPDNLHFGRCGFVPSPPRVDWWYGTAYIYQ